MDQISYQNGFICGMATKGLVRSGQPYQPIIYNDESVYDYFYIDFRRAIEPFSLGMWNESIVVHDSEQLTVTQTAEVSLGIYKIYCDIRNKIHGITVLNKKTSRLRFASTGERVPVFSIHMFIEGQPAYVDGGYVYEPINLQSHTFDATETLENLLWTAIDAGSFYESVYFEQASFTPIDTITINFT